MHILWFQQKYIDGYIADKKRFDEEMAVYRLFYVCSSFNDSCYVKFCDDLLNSGSQLWSSAVVRVK